MSCPRSLLVGFSSRSTGSPLTKSIGTTSITRGCLSSTVSVFKPFRQRSRSPAASRQLPTVFFCAFRFARFMLSPAYHRETYENHTPTLVPSSEEHLPPALEPACYFAIFVAWFATEIQLPFSFTYTRVKRLSPLLSLPFSVPF